MKKREDGKGRTALCEICGEPLSMGIRSLTYEEENHAFKEALKANELSAWELGEHWHNLCHGLLKGHYSSPSEYLRKEFKGTGRKPPPRTTLAAMAKVQHIFKTADVGVSWYLLYLAIRYWKLAGVMTFSRSFPGNELIRVPVLGGAVIEMPLQDCGQDDLKRAIKQFRNRDEPELSAKDLALEKLLQAGAKKLAGSQGTSSVHLERNKAGDLLADVHFKADVEKLAKLFKGLI